jgi:hypothetical protein
MLPALTLALTLASVLFVSTISSLMTLSLRGMKEGAVPVDEDEESPPLMVLWAA